MTSQQTGVFASFIDALALTMGYSISQPKVDESPNESPAIARSDAGYMPSVWQNSLTGLGTSSDRMTWHVPGGIQCLPDEILAQLYYQDPIAKKIVAKVVDKAFSKGFTITYSGPSEKSRDLIPEITKRSDELELESKAVQAARWGRLYGGGGLFAVTDDGDPEDPFDLSRVREIRSLSVVDKRDLSVFEWYNDPLDENFGKHRYYNLSLYDASVSSITKLHASRVFRFRGTVTATRDSRMYFDSWDASVLQAVWEVLRAFNSDRQSISLMLSDSSVSVIKLKDMWQTAVSNSRGAIDEMIGFLQQKLSVGKILPLDKEDDFIRVERSFASIPQLLAEEQAIVSAAADMPITELFGASASGLSATGEGDRKSWHSQVESQRSQIFEPPIVQAVQVIAKSIGAPDPENFGIQWAELEELSAKEKSDLEKQQTETDVKRVNDLGFPRDSLMIQRYGGEYNPNPPVLTQEDIDDIHGVTIAGEEIAAEISGEQGIAEQQAIQLENDLKVIEQLVKSKAPDEMIREMISRVARKLNVDTPSVLAAIAKSSFRWYTEVQAEISATGEKADARQWIDEARSLIVLSGANGKKD